MSDDFFVYYKTEEDVSSTGLLKVISPTRQNIDLPFIRIPYELGIRFTPDPKDGISKESPSIWHVRWNSAREEMEITRKGELPEFGHIRGFRRIPEPHETDHIIPDIVVTWHEERNVFVITGSKLLDATYRNLDFFVTENCDPNVLHFGFRVSTASIARGISVTCDIDLPDDFSIFTRMCFDGYLLRKEQ